MLTIYENKTKSWTCQSKQDFIEEVRSHYPKAVFETISREQMKERLFSCESYRQKRISYNEFFKEFVCNDHYTEHDDLSPIEALLLESYRGRKQEIQISWQVGGKPEADRYKEYGKDGEFRFYRDALEKGIKNLRIEENGKLIYNTETLFTTLCKIFSFWNWEE